VTRPRLAVTLGDPEGIGPEIVGAAAVNTRVLTTCDLVIIGPEGTRTRVDESIGAWAPGASGGASAGALAARAIERAVMLAQRGDVAGIVTAPIDKHELHKAGFKDPGHTEMLSRLTGAPVAMMLASDRLRVILATTHIALRDVPTMLTKERITATARVAFAGLREWYGIAEPRIALCAMNPHAGDQGSFGSEDDDLLAPAARAAGLSGPFPADTVFVRAMEGEFDAVIAPYHDVGMTAIKVASFGSAVNVTLGLPWPRTSPDHGTAKDIAGTGRAKSESMVLAILECARIAQRLAAK
jgi:4-hydroxythreonine-4-phosphate dehydrogenase